MNDRYKEPGAFRFKGRFYDMGDIFALAAQRATVRLPLTEFSGSQVDPLDLEDLDKVDLDYPIIVFRDHGEWIVVDGKKRLNKAISLGRRSISVKRLGSLPKAVPHHLEYYYCLPTTNEKCKIEDSNVTLDSTSVEKSEVPKTPTRVMRYYILGIGIVIWFALVIAGILFLFHVRTLGI